MLWTETSSCFFQKIEMKYYVSSSNKKGNKSIGKMKMCEHRKIVLLVMGKHQNTFKGHLSKKRINSDKRIQSKQQYLYIARAQKFDFVNFCSTGVTMFFCFKKENKVLVVMQVYSKGWLGIANLKKIYKDRLDLGLTWLK